MIEVAKLEQVVSDPILEMLCAGTSTLAEYILQTPAGPEEWIMLTCKNHSLPGQGWKLHVSATRYSAPDVLRSVLPILFGERVSFKVAPLTLLELLNSGASGLSQIGKFITIYPRDDEQAVRLAIALDKATTGLQGPAVLSDRRLSLTSIVSYRYGSFDKRSIQDSDGLILSAIEAPDGNLVADRRLSTYIVPSWVTDPFAAAGIVNHKQTDEIILAQRYILTGLLSQSARGAVYLAIDLDQKRACIIKQARQNALVAADGSDACARLRYECAMLKRLAPYADVPEYYDLFNYQGDLFLVMEYIQGEMLGEYVRRQVNRGTYLPIKKIISWARALAEMLASIHAQGFVLCDLKAANLILSKRQRLCLIDLEMVVEQHTAKYTPFGTRGYMSPQRQNALPPTPSDDIYSFGALLYFLVTGAEPAIAPQPHNLLARPLETVRPDIPDQLAHVIRTCLDPDSSKRWALASQLVDALTSIQLKRSRASTKTSQYSDRPHQHYSELAYELGDSLAITIKESVTASQNMLFATTLQNSSLGSGLAGIVISLASLVQRFPQASFSVALKDAVKAMMRVPLPHGGERHAGLYTGRAGVSLALLRAGQALNEPTLIDLALQEAKQIANLPHHSPDLFAGSAGRLRLHLKLWQASNDLAQLEAAVECGAYLLQSAHEQRSGELQWILPSGYGINSGKAFVGYAYGATGIGDALLDLFAVTQDERLAQAVCAVTRWLTRLAKPAGSKRYGLGWPAVEGSSIDASYWSHGASGIGRFFLSAARYEFVPNARDMAEGAARRSAYRTYWTGPSLAYGLAGNINYLLDSACFFKDALWSSEAYKLACLLETFATKQPRLLWRGDDGDKLDISFLTGSAGILVCLLRLSAPDQHLDLFP